MPDSVAFRHLQNLYEGGTAYTPHLLTACGGKTSCRDTAGDVKTPCMYVLLVVRDTLHVHIWLLVSLNLLCGVKKSYGNAEMYRKIKKLVRHRYFNRLSAASVRNLHSGIRVSPVPLVTD